MSNVTIEDIKKVLGIILYMGIVKLRNRGMYWQSQTRIDLVAYAMPVDRFSQVLQVLHYNDNNLIPNVRITTNVSRCNQPLIEFLRKKFKTVVIPETPLSVDEQVIPFKGASCLKRYLPKKPKKLGYKLWAPGFELVHRESRFAVRF